MKTIKRLFCARERSAKGALPPLPLGEGWGEGFGMSHYSWCFPHPTLLPEGEGTRQNHCFIYRTL